MRSGSRTSPIALTPSPAFPISALISAMRFSSGPRRWSSGSPLAEGSLRFARTSSPNRAAASARVFVIFWIRLTIRCSVFCAYTVARRNSSFPLSPLAGHERRMNQLELFAPPAQKKAEMPTAESVRPRLEAVLQQLRDGSASRWSEAEKRRWAVVFPQMCEWLPEAERELKRAEFLRLWARQDA